MMWRGSKPNCVHGNQSYFVIPICLYLRKQSFQNLHLYLFKTYPEIVREPVCVCVCVCVCVLRRNILSSFTPSKESEDRDGLAQKVHRHEDSWQFL